MTRKENIMKDKVPDVKHAPLPGPGALAVLTLFAGPHISLLPLLAIFSRLSLPKGYRILPVFTAIVYPLLYILLLFWQMKWYWASFIIIGANLICSVAYYLLLRKIYIGNPAGYQTEPHPSSTQGNRYILAGMAGGAGLVPLLGAPFVLLFLLASDRLLLSIMPLAFDDYTAIYLMVLAIFGLILTGCIAGGWSGRLAFQAKPLGTIVYSLTLVLISLTWYFCLLAAITLPAFLTSQADSQSMGLSFLTFFIGYIFIGSWWCPYLQINSMMARSAGSRVGRLIFSQVACISAAIIYGIASGYPATWFHSAGKYFEKQGQLPAALWSYEQGLSRKPDGIHASYLQNRIALAEHKLGNTDRAVKGFRKIVSHYNYDEELVTRASQFLDNIERKSETGKRVVLPGVDNPTAYKGAYCVPNSLALVMNFWGAEVDAGEIGRQITSLAGGTMTVDQTWFAAKSDFNHEFVPMARVEDIKRTIDAGFPVMVYVPQHVFVIVGYDEQLETFVTYDVATGDVWVEYLQREFIKSWKKEDSTMIIAYPKAKEEALPDSLRQMIAERSESYFQYHLHKVRSYSPFGHMDHLSLATDSSSSYFFPLVTLFQKYPASRGKINAIYDIDHLVDNIEEYYGRDFDEGIHLAGQYHDSSYADSDEDLKQSLDFLIGVGRMEETRELIESIEDNGIISDDTSETLSVLHLALGDMETAIPMLENQDDGQLQFYLAQSYLEQQNTQSAIAGLIETVDDCT